MDSVRRTRLAWHFQRARTVQNQSSAQVDRPEQGDRIDMTDLVSHLDAAYNLARWLTRNEHDAEDIVHEAYLRAFRFSAGFRGSEVPPWLLTIVRNSCYDFLRQKQAHDG